MARGRRANCHRHGSWLASWFPCVWRTGEFQKLTAFTLLRGGSVCWLALGYRQLMFLKVFIYSVPVKPSLLEYLLTFFLSLRHLSHFSILSLPLFFLTLDTPSNWLAANVYAVGADAGKFEAITGVERKCQASVIFQNITQVRKTACDYLARRNVELGWTRNESPQSRMVQTEL